jgi:hypothetical protein
MTRPSNAGSTESQGKQAGRKIPEQPRDCGPQVDTWPILDTQIGDAPKPKTDEAGNPKPISGN